ncbi:MAG TPA: phytanoyl-CoA dioxygenase family protein [Streptosporangiaceae bacterium]|nr:phytanoyl-CoA dioxygenase family protein [Streptosporangiaceae bacterium]
MAAAEIDPALLPTEQDVRFYEQHGWWISPPIVPDDLIDDARFGADRYYAGEKDEFLLFEAGTDWSPSHGDVLRQNDYVSLQIDQLRQLVKHELIAHAAAILARTDQIRLFHDQLIYKPPRVDPFASTVGWHTDIAYWKTCSSRNLITAWIPFQPVTMDMGPMTVLDRSHRWTGNEHLEFFHDPDLLGIERRIDKNSDRLDEMPLLLDAGQVSFHHCCTIHGSKPNHSGRPRLALAVHMQDRDNHYRAAEHNGKPVTHLNDFLCRRDAAGNPDYADPDICPVLWEARQS